MPSLSDVFISNDAADQPAGTSPAEDGLELYQGSGPYDGGGTTETGGEQDGNGNLLGVTPEAGTTTADLDA